MRRRAKRQTKDLEKPTHPLLLWRERHNVNQEEVARACRINQTFVSKIELYQRVPLGDSLEELRRYTGLPTDAFIRPTHFLQEHPHFLEATHGPPEACL